MKRTNYLAILIAFCFVLIIFLASCDSTSKTNDFNEVSMREYYKIEDFESITIGESTYQEVYKVAYSESMQITSYGGFCEYPMENGGYVCIKFYGKDLIVGAIEEVSLQIETE